MIVVIVGARPNFMKVAALLKHLKLTVIHTGQHQGAMADNFFKEFKIRPIHCQSPALPDLVNILKRLQPKLVIVVGDVDSTVLGAVATKANGLKLAHVEAGLRSGDMTMPEEVNRILVDNLSDYLFVTEQAGMDNLKREGVKGKTYLVGNVMIDNLAKLALVTLHRPSNVDNKPRLQSILKALTKLKTPLIWPLHPRTKANLLKFKLTLSPNITVLPPQSHHKLIQLIKESEYIITDSGGIQEEAAYLGRRTFVLRDTTERPITVQYGNQLVTPEELPNVVPNIPLWDGHASERIASIIQGILS